MIYNVWNFDYKTCRYLPVVVIMCGPPASGKSTFIKKTMTGTFATLSRDEIRGRWYGPKYKPNKTREDAVTLEYNAFRKGCIKREQHIIVDKTNCNEGHLNEEIKTFKDSGYIIFIKFFDVSYPMLIFREIKRRLTNRSKPSVPFKVIKDMKKRYDKIDKSKYNEYIFH